MPICSPYCLSVYTSIILDRLPEIFSVYTTLWADVFPAIDAGPDSRIVLALVSSVGEVTAGGLFNRLISWSANCFNEILLLLVKFLTAP